MECGGFCSVPEEGTCFRSDPTIPLSSTEIQFLDNKGFKRYVEAEDADILILTEPKVLSTRQVTMLSSRD